MMDSPYRRMVLLPHTEYEQLKECKADTSQLYWPSDTSTEREQKLYALSLRKKRQSPTASGSTAKTTHATLIEAEIKHFPTGFRSRAERLLAALSRRRPEIDWNNDGEVTIGTHASPLAGSNIIDLIYHATAVKRRNFEPSAWSEFVGALKEFNIPSSVLNAETLKEMQRDAAQPRPGRRLRRQRQQEEPELLKEWINLK